MRNTGLYKLRNLVHREELAWPKTGQITYEAMKLYKKDARRVPITSIPALRMRKAIDAVERFGPFVISLYCREYS